MPGERQGATRWKHKGVAALSGVLLTAAFPKLGASSLVWVALVPLLFALRSGDWRRGFVLGWVTGAAHYLTLIYWVAYTMTTYGHLPWTVAVAVLLIFAAFLACYPALVAAAAVRLASTPARLLWALPVLWTAGEYLRGHLLSGFPWEQLGCALYRTPTLIQVADLGGVYAVSFPIAMANAAIFLALLALTRGRWRGKRVSWRPAAGGLAAAALLVLAVWTYGHWRLNGIARQIAEAPSARIAVIQGNIEQALKWEVSFQRHTVDKYLRLSRQAKTLGPDLLVWPETAAPFYFIHDAPLTGRLRRGVASLRTACLLGSPFFQRRPAGTDYFNSAFLLDGAGRVTDRYDKAHLVPFGEYVPFKKYLPFLGKMVAQVGDFVPGPKGRILSSEIAELGVQICYEVIFAPLSRAQVRNGANLLVNITNDAWYGTTSAPYQHFSMTVFRAVENRRSLARAANTGISGLIDPAGRILERTELFRDAFRVQAVPLLETRSLYTRCGDLFALSCLATAAGALGWRLAGDRRSGRRPRGAATGPPDENSA